MKINFIKNGLHEKEIKDIDELIITEFNPRFYLIDDVNNNLLQLFKKDVSSENKQQEIANKIIKFEGDFAEFEDLLSSIYKDGFDNTTEPILLVKNLNGKFIVVEGNRRVLSLKLINQNLHLENFSKAIDKIKGYEDSISDFTEEMNEDFDIKPVENMKYFDLQRKRYESCLRLLDKIRKQYQSFDVHYKVINNEEEIWKFIYDKHLVGIRPGMRKWSRSKYFADLLMWFLNFHELNDWEKDIFLNTLSKKINRNTQKIKEDYMQAQLMYCFLYYGENYYLDDNCYDRNNTIHKPTNNINKDIIEDLLSIEHPSALEKVHSYNKVRTIACSPEFLNISLDDFKSKYHDINFDNNNRILLLDKNISSQILFSFIYRSWKNGIITTRSIKEKDAEKFYSDLKDVFNITIRPKYFSDEEIDKINEFSFTIDKLESIIKLNEYRHPFKINRFKEALKVMNYNQIFIKQLEEKFPENRNKIEPIKVFHILYQQLKYVSRKNFLNAIASTLRALIEQIVVWFYCEIEPNTKEKEKHIISIVSGNVNDAFRKVRIKFDDDQSMIADFVDVSCNLDQKTKNMMINFFGQLLIDPNKKNNFSNSLNSKILNDFVHASHQIYIDTKYVGNLKSLNYILENVIIFIENMNIDVIASVNQKIIDLLNPNNRN